MKSVCHGCACILNINSFKSRFPSTDNCQDDFSKLSWLFDTINKWQRPTKKKLSHFPIWMLVIWVLERCDTLFVCYCTKFNMNNWITMKTVVLGIAWTKKWLMLEICRYFYKIYIEWMVVILGHCSKCNSIHIFIQLAKNDSYSEWFPLYRAWVELCWIWYTNNTVLNGWKHISFRCKKIFHAENDVI